jgi:hypothetical protein
MSAQSNSSSTLKRVINDAKAAVKNLAVIA